MKRLSLQYVAGLTDGEGCISAHVNRATDDFRPRVVFQFAISNTNTAILKALRRQFGGSYHKHLSIQRARPEHKPSYNWSLSERAAAELLKKLLPYLRIKRRQAILGIRLLRLKDRYRKNKKGRPQGLRLTEKEYAQRIAIANQFRILNRRGQ